ncbi:MAG TPA: electron transfer flavoprotein subunit beta/FixA family protein, partial [Gemmatimonadales bacterium]|nr:electron transfer flavoprotein subunit beta/FixA family protein [Gemmatimonadales bacterium]
LVTVGPERAQSALRTGLAMGADSALHVKDPLLDGADTLGVARALAAAVRTLAPFHLVLTGQQGVGGDHSQIPGLLAELLDLPQVTVAVKIELQEGQALVQREVDGGRETWQTPLPALISAQKGLNEPRYASLKGIMAAKKKPIEVKPAALGESRVTVTSLGLPAERKAGRIVGEGPDAVPELVRLLRAEAKVL